MTIIEPPNDTVGGIDAGLNSGGERGGYGESQPKDAFVIHRVDQYDAEDATNTGTSEDHTSANTDNNERPPVSANSCWDRCCMCQFYLMFGIPLCVFAYILLDAVVTDAPATEPPGTETPATDSPITEAPDPGTEPPIDALSLVTVLLVAFGMYIVMWFFMMAILVGMVWFFDGSRHSSNTSHPVDSSNNDASAPNVATSTTLATSVPSATVNTAPSNSRKCYTRMLALFFVAGSGGVAYGLLGTLPNDWTSLALWGFLMSGAYTAFQWAFSALVRNQNWWSQREQRHNEQPTQLQM